MNDNQQLTREQAWENIRLQVTPFHWPDVASAINTIREHERQSLLTSLLEHPEMKDEEKPSDKDVKRLRKSGDHDVLGQWISEVNGANELRAKLRAVIEGML